MSSNEPRPPFPAPSGLSDQARQYLEMPSQYSAEVTQPDPSDTEAMLSYIRAADEMLAELLGGAVDSEAVARADFELDGVTTFVLRPDHVADGPETPIYIDIHGGALIMGAGEACLAMVTPGAARRDAITWAPDYRMPPLHPYPAALDDLMAVYRKALDERDPSNIVVAGSSAGGNLAAALLLRAKDEGLEMPAALALLTPEVDLTESGDTFQTLLGVDNVLGLLMETNLLYADGHDLSHPYLSPLFGDVSGFPPTYLQSGTRDLFLSNTVRMHRKLRAAGVDAELHVGEAMPHGGFGGTAPEDLELAAELTRFVKRHLS